MTELEEKKYNQLRKLGQELHIPIPEHFLELEVRDKDGKVIQTIKQRSHSWVRNAYNLLLSGMASKNIDAGVGEYGAGYLSIKDTGGTIKRGAMGVLMYGVGFDLEDVGTAYRAAAANTAFGILVGSDATAESFEDHKLLAQIGEGMAAGQLNHMLMAVPSRSYAALTWTIAWNRYFNNNSPGNVIVNEVCLACNAYAAGAAKFITSRDKLGSTVTIPATGQLKVTYTIQLTYPE